MCSDLYRVLSAVLLCIGLSSCGAPQSSEAAPIVTQQTTASSVTTTAATTVSAEPKPLQFAQSHTKTICELIARRHFTAKMESYYQNTLLAVVYMEVNGNDLHLRTEYVDTGKVTEMYCLDDTIYMLRDGIFQPFDTVNRYSIENDPNNELLCGLFFNCGDFPGSMAALSCEETGNTVTERFGCANAGDIGSIREMYFVYEKQSGVLLTSGYKESVQQVVSLQETVGQITLPEQAAHSIS